MFKRQLRFLVWIDLFSVTVLWAGWGTEYVETGNINRTVGFYTSLKVDTSGYPHIVYSEPYPQMDARHARWTGLNWEISSVETGELLEGDYTSLALDKNNIPHISFYRTDGSELIYATFKSKQWRLTAVDTVGDTGWYSSIAVCSSDIPHISYQNRTSYDLKYAVYESTGWNKYFVDSTGEVGEYSSIAVDQAGIPHISYYDSTNKALKYATRLETGQWKKVFVDSTTGTDIGKFCSLTISKNNDIHISYYNATTQDLKYAYLPAGQPPELPASWQISTLATTGNIGQYTSIDLDKYFNPHIVCYTATYTNPVYLYRDSTGTWTQVMLEYNGNIGQYSSIQVDNDGFAHISCFDLDQQSLVYIHYDPYIPSNITDLLAETGIREGEIILTWTAPGDDGTYGTIVGGKIQPAYSTLSTDDWSTSMKPMATSTTTVANSWQQFKVTGLTPGTTYFLRLKMGDDALNWTDQTNQVSAWAQYDIHPPDKISDLFAETGPVEGTVKLSWTAPGDDYDINVISTGTYELYYTTTVTTTWNQSEFYIKLSTTTIPKANQQIIITGLIPLTSYYFWLRTIDDRLNVAPLSDKVTAQAQIDVTSPRAITDLVATRDNTIETQLRLTWTAPGDDGYLLNISSGRYQIKYTVDTMKPWTNTEYILLFATNVVPGTLQTYIIPGLVPKTTYYIWILTADELVNWSPVSNRTYAWAQVDVTPPAQINDLTSLPGRVEGEIQLAWTSPGDNGVSGQLVNSKYIIKYTSNSNTSWDDASITVEISTTQAPGFWQNIYLPNLSDRVTYYFWIQTEDDNFNASLVSPRKSGVPQRDITAPQPIGDLTAGLSKNGGEIILTWTVSGDDEVTGPINNGKYYIRLTSNVANINWDKMEHQRIIVSTSTPAREWQRYPVRLLKEGVTYYFLIKVADEWDNLSKESNSTSNWAGYDSIAPNVVTDLVAFTGDNEGEVTFTWTPPGDDGTIGDITAGYLRVSKSTSPVQNWDPQDFHLEISTDIAALTPQRWVVNKLASGTQYYFHLWVGDEIQNWSSLSNQVTATAQVGTAPAKVNDFSAQPGEDHGTIFLSWTATGDDGYLGNIIDGWLNIKYSNNSNDDYNTAPYSILRTTSTKVNEKQHITIYDLPAGTTFYFFLKIADEAYNWTEVTGPQPTPVQYDAIAPQPVQNFIATALPEGRKLQLTWTNSIDLDYRKTYLRYSDTATIQNYDEGELIYTGTKNSFTLTGLTDKQTYFFLIYTIDEVPNRSPVTTYVTYPLDITPPGQVQNLRAEVPTQGNIVKVLWNSNTEDDLLGYYIYRALEDWNFVRISTSATSPYLDSGLVNNTAYYYKLAAYDLSLNEGIQSNIAMQIPKDQEPPGQVTNLKIFPLQEGKSLMLTYTPPTDKDVIKFSIAREKVGTGFNIIGSTGNTTYYDTGLVDGTTYLYRVAAVDSSNNRGEWSAIKTGIPQDIQAVNKVTEFKVYASTEGNHIILEWLNPNLPDWQGTLIVYSSLTQIYSPQFEIDNLLYNGKSNTYDHYKLIDNLTYYYTAFTYDSALNYSSGVVTSAFPYDSLPPKKVQNFYVNTEPTGKKVLLSWPVGYESDLVGYKIYRTTDNFNYTHFPVLDWKTTYYIDTFIKSNNTYYYSITSYDEVPNESAVLPFIKTVPNDLVPPKPVSNVKPNLILNLRKIFITWTNPTDLDWLGTKLMVSTSTTPTIKTGHTLSSGTSNFYEHTNLTPDTSYFYTLFTFDEVYNYSIGISTYIYLPDIFPPEKVKNIKIQTILNDVHFTWDKVPDRDLRGYYIYRSTDYNTGYSTASFTVTETTIDYDVYNETTNYYYLTATDFTGNESEISEIVNGYPHLAPFSPLGVYTMVNDGKLTITWSPVNVNADNTILNDLAGYIVYRKEVNEPDFVPVLTISSTTIHWDEPKRLTNPTQYYLKTFDIWDNLSLPSAIIDWDKSVTLLYQSSDGIAELRIPQDIASKILYAETNSYQTDLRVEIVPQVSDELRTLYAYEFKTFRGSTNEEIVRLSLPTPDDLVTVRFRYFFSDQKGAPPVAYKYSSLNVTEQNIVNWLSAYHFNGVKNVNLGGRINTQNKNVYFRTNRLGLFSLRLTYRTDEFTLLSTEPKKIFYPQGINNKFRINFANPKDETNVYGTIYDISGQEIAILDQAGDQFVWDGNDRNKNIVNPGVYIYQIKVGTKVFNGTVVVAR